VNRTSCPECQQADSDVGIWTGLSRVRVLWSRPAYAIAAESLLQRANLCFPNPAPDTRTPQLMRFWELWTLRYHVLPFRIWIRTCLTEDEAW